MRFSPMLLFLTSHSLEVVREVISRNTWSCKCMTVGVNGERIESRPVYTGKEGALWGVSEILRCTRQKEEVGNLHEKVHSAGRSCCPSDPDNSAPRSHNRT